MKFIKYLVTRKIGDKIYFDYLDGAFGEIGGHEEFLRYIGKKRVRYTLHDNYIVLEGYPKTTVDNLLHYFKLGTDVTEIPIDTLYAAWKDSGNISKGTFIRELEKVLLAKNFTFFIDAYLNITSYKPTKTKTRA